MATRTVTVALNANVSGLLAGLGKAQAATTKFASDAQKRVGNALDRIEKSSESFNAVGNGLLKVGAAGAAGLTLVGKAALDWESAWAGVNKTVDGTPAQMSALESELRKMATTLPATHEEIAGVAEAAGQLGIQRDSIAGFTKTMVDLGETTNLSAGDAATALARFSNIMGTSSDDVDRLGSTIVDLGNNSATTEAEIVQMGLRIAGAGRQIGLSESDVFAYAAALSSVGVEAEAGGTAISQFMLRTENAVRDGGKELDIFARTAGMSAGEFSTAFEQDAAGALDAFLQGLGRAQASGEDTNAILEQLGVTGIREADALRRLASSGTLLAESLETGSAAWEDNLALAEEAAKRYETTESQIRVAWNQIKDSAIDAGAVILPAIASIAQGVGQVATAFGELPPGAQQALVAGTIVVTAAALIGGAILTLLPRIAAARVAMVDIGKASPGLAKGMGRVGGAMRKAAGAASAFGLAAAAASLAGQAIASFQPKTKPVIEYENALIAMAKGGDGAADAMNKLLDDGVWGEAGTQVTDLSTAFKQLAENENFFNNAISSAGDALGGIQTSQRAVQSQFQAIDQALAGMDSKNAVKAFKEVAKSADEAGISHEDLLKTFPQYKARLTEVANQLGVTSLSAEEYVNWMGGKVPDAVKKAAAGNKEAERAVKSASGEMRNAAEAAEAYAAQLEALADQALANSDAEIGFREAVAEVSTAIKENGKTLDLHSKKGRENQKVLNDVVSRGRAWIKTLDESSASSKEVTIAQREVARQIYQAGRDMGKSKEEALKYAKQMLAIPDKVSTAITLPGVKTSEAQAKKINDQLAKIKPQYRAKIISAWESGGYNAAKKAINSLPKSKNVYLTTTHTTIYKTQGSRPAFGGPKIIQGYADGGPIGGYSPHPKADNLLAAVTAGEFMLRHASHSKYGTDNLQALNRGEVDPTALSRLVKGYANGGPISQGTAPMIPSAALQNQRIDIGERQTTNYNSFNLPNQNPYAVMMAAGQTLRGL